MNYQKISDLEKTLTKLRENNGDLFLQIRIRSGERTIRAKVVNVSLVAHSEKKFTVFVEGLDFFPDAVATNEIPRIAVFKDFSNR